MNKKEQRTVERNVGSMEYARELFTEYFDTQGSIAFTTLGYTDAQKRETKMALGAMSQVGGILESKPLRVRYPFSAEGGMFYQVTFSELGQGGYKLVASNFPMALLTQNSPDLVRIMEQSNTGLPKETFGSTLAVLEMLPKEADVEDLRALVNHIYNAAWAVRNMVIQRNDKEMSNIHQADWVGFLRSILSRTKPSYRAAWTDPATKLEFVVETDVYDLLDRLRRKSRYGKPGIVREVWRRLPETTGPDQKVWIPFGKKPNPSKEQVQRALEGKPEKHFSAKTALQGNR